MMEYIIIQLVNVLDQDMGLKLKEEKANFQGGMLLEKI